MSEYQYYEFRAIDRPLTREQIDEVRQFSARAEITATSFVNEYQFGDFNGNPDLLVTKYFDLMYYCCKWPRRFARSASKPSKYSHRKRRLGQRPRKPRSASNF